MAWKKRRHYILQLQLRGPVAWVAFERGASQMISVGQGSYVRIKNRPAKDGCGRAMMSLCSANTAPLVVWSGDCRGVFPVATSPCAVRAASW